MLTSVRALLNEIIDYAGLFPPAQLDMSTAVDRFLGHRGGPDRWMLARFVCPTSRLDELSPLLGRVRDSLGPFRLTVLGRGGSTAESFSAAISADVDDIEWFSRLHGTRAPIEQFEVRLPDAAGNLDSCVVGAVDQLSRTPSRPLAFFETPLLDDWRSRLPKAAAAVLAAAGRGGSAGIKIRCGGLDASAVPSPVAVAAALTAGIELEVPIKATQGLHHPVRHFDPELETMAHGFLNLFASGILAHSRNLDEESLLELLEEDDPAEFDFSDTSFRWHHMPADIGHIEYARTNVVTSFGSCSFSEPRDYLRELGLLPSDETNDDDRLAQGGEPV